MRCLASLLHSYSFLGLTCWYRFSSCFLYTACCFVCEYIL
nr:MAG TPA: hypothetical protein [Caudoviricetes sp.]